MDKPLISLVRNYLKATCRHGGDTTRAWRLDEDILILAKQNRAGFIYRDTLICVRPNYSQEIYFSDKPKHPFMKDRKKYMIKTSLEPYGEFFQYPENVPVWSVDSRVSGNVGISSEADVEADVEIDGLRNIDERTIRQWTTRAPFADMLSTEPDEEPEEGE